MIKEFFILLVLFQLKHFICDYPLQNKYMLGKFKDGWHWAMPLLEHAATHGIGTMLILWCFAPNLLWLMPVDIMIHFCVDRVKANKKLLGRWKPDQPYFWWALGLDQMLHHLTHYVFIYLIITG